MADELTNKKVYTMIPMKLKLALQIALILCAGAIQACASTAHTITNSDGDLVAQAVESGIVGLSFKVIDSHARGDRVSQNTWLQTQIGEPISFSALERFFDDLTIEDGVTKESQLAPMDLGLMVALQPILYGQGILVQVELHDRWATDRQAANQIHVTELKATCYVQKQACVITNGQRRYEVAIATAPDEADSTDVAAR